MIIYGSREATLQTMVFEDQFCTDCGQKGSISCTVFSKHAHIFWIPLFPFSKRKAIWCNNCGKEFAINELTPEMQSEVNNFYRKNKAPFWQWVGLLLFTVSVILSIIGNIKEGKNTELFLNSPEINDVYCVKEEEGYSLMYIDEIIGDSVFFIDNNYVCRKLSDVKKLHRLDYYDLDVVYGFSREELNELFHEEKYIKEIWRNLRYSTRDVKTRGGIKESSFDVEEYSDDEDDFEEDEEEDSEDNSE